MPSNATTGGAAVAGLLAGLAFGQADVPVPADSTTLSSAVDRLDTIEVTTEGGVAYAIIEKKSGDVQTSVTPYSAQYVANAVRDCDDYEADKGARTARCARWDAMKSRLEEAGHTLPAPGTMD